MRKIVLTFGLVAGAILAVMMALTLPFQDRIGFEHGYVVGYTTMVLAFLAVFAAVKSCRDDACGGRIGFGRALLVGVLVTLVATACYVVAWELIYHFFMPDYMDKYAAFAVEQLRKAGGTEAQLAAKAREMADFKRLYANPLVNIAFTAIEPLPVGLLFSVVAAAVFSRRPRPSAAAPS